MVQTVMPKEALIAEVTEKIQAASGTPIILDFDNTLFLDNSTERFLDAMRPRMLAFLVVVCSDWLLTLASWLGICRYNDQRDFWRVLCCSILMPWSLLRWRRIAPALGRRLMNHTLTDPLSSHQPVIVLSYGFHHVIAPLLGGMGLARTTLVCSRMWPRLKNLRSWGKRNALAQYFPASQWERSLFITDSDDDADVVQAIPQSFVLQWAPGRGPAFQGLYVPLRYTVEGKYPNSRYFTYQIVLEDFMLLLLAYTFAWQYAFALWWLFISLYSIYEIGYFNNDRHAIAHETNPVVSEGSHRFTSHPRFKPWLYAGLFALIGLTPLLFCSLQPTPALTGALLKALGCWLAALVCLHGLFWLFNRWTPRQRVVLFPFLHLFKTFSFMLFVPLPFLGVLLLSSQVISISVNYGLYRFGGDVDRFNRQTWRMICFFILTAGAVAILPGAIGKNDLARLALIAAWGAIRALERAKRRNILRLLVETVKGATV